MKRTVGLLACTIFLGGCSMPRAPRCDTRKVLIGMTRDEVLAVCPGPNREYDYGGGDTYKFHNGEERSDPVAHWMGWNWWDDSSDLVTLKDGKVSWTHSSRPLP